MQPDWSALPTDLWAEIFKRGTAQDRLSCMAVSKEFNRVLNTFKGVWGGLGIHARLCTDYQQMGNPKARPSKADCAAARWVNVSGQDMAVGLLLSCRTRPFFEEFADWLYPVRGPARLALFDRIDVEVDFGEDLYGPFAPSPQDIGMWGGSDDGLAAADILAGDDPPALEGEEEDDDPYREYASLFGFLFFELRHDPGPLPQVSLSLKSTFGQESAFLISSIAQKVQRVFDDLLQPGARDRLQIFAHVRLPTSSASSNDYVRWNNVSRSLQAFPRSTCLTLSTSGHLSLNRGFVTRILPHLAHSFAEVHLELPLWGPEGPGMVLIGLGNLVEDEGVAVAMEDFDSDLESELDAEEVDFDEPEPEAAGPEGQGGPGGQALAPVVPPAEGPVNVAAGAPAAPVPGGEGAPPVRALRPMLSAGAGSRPILRTLSLDLTSRIKLVEGPRLASILEGSYARPFFASVAPSLESLTLTVPVDGPSTSSAFLSLFARLLPSFCRLEALKLDLSAWRAGPRFCAQFLQFKRHANESALQLQGTEDPFGPGPLVLTQALQSLLDAAPSRLATVAVRDPAHSLLELMMLAGGMRHVDWWLEERKGNLNVLGECPGSTPLSLCGVSHASDLVDTLVAKGATLELRDPRDRTSRTALHYAVLHACGCTEVIDALLDQGADLEARDARGDTPYLLALRCGNSLKAQHLRSRGADTRAVNHRGQTGLLVPFDRTEVTPPRGWAEEMDEIAAEVYEEGLTMAEFRSLVDSDLELVCRRDHEGTSLLHALVVHCLKIRQLDKLRYVLQHPVVGTQVAQQLINCRTATSGATPLHALFRDPDVVGGYFFQFNGLAMLDLLVAKGADVTAQDAEGNTPLHLAAAGGASGVVLQKLLSKGASARVVNVKGETPVKLARGKMKKLLRKRADEEAREEGAHRSPTKDGVGAGAGPAAGARSGAERVRGGGGGGGGRPEGSRRQTRSQTAAANAAKQKKKQ